MIYGFAIDGSLSTDRFSSVLDRVVTKAHVLYAHVCVDVRENTST